MANQVALRILTHPGDDVVVGASAHAVWHEAGASPPTPACSSPKRERRHVHRRQFLAVRKPRGHMLLPADDGGGDREHPQSRRRHRRFRRRRGASACRRARAQHRDVAGRGAALECGSRHRCSPGGAGRAIRPRVGRAVEGPRSARRVTAGRARGRNRPRRSVHGACSAARCARSASSPPPGCTRSTTTSTRLADDHANARRIAVAACGSPRILSISPPCRPTS